MGLFDSIGSDLGSAIGTIGSGGLNLVGQGGGSLGDILTGGAISNAGAVEATNAQNIGYQNATNAQSVALANSTYQRSVADLKAAGLNPMLAYSGNTDPMPSMTAPQAQAPRPGDIGAGLFNSAMAIASRGQDIKQSNSQIDVNTHTAANLEAQATKATANANESVQNAKLTGQLIQKAKADTKRASSEANISGMKEGVAASRFDMDKKLAPANAIGEMANQASGTIRNAVSAFNPFSSYSKGFQRGRSGGVMDGFGDGYERGTRAGSVN